MAQILEVFRASHRTYGYRRVTFQLQRLMSINHKAVLRLMNKLGIRSQTELVLCAVRRGILSTEQ